MTLRCPFSWIVSENQYSVPFLNCDNKKRASPRIELNYRPIAYKAIALPTELPGQLGTKIS